MEMETGDILLVHTKKGKNKFMSFLAKAIRWFQENRWNHSAILIKIDGIIYVSEADNYGVGFQTFEHYLDKNKFDIKILRYKKGLSKEQKFKLKHFTIEFSNNVPYGKITLILYQGFRYLSKKIFGKAIWIGEKTEKKADNTMICGKWVAYCYYKIENIFLNWKEFAPADIDKSNLFEEVYP